MRRHRRHRFLTYSVLIIAYSIFQSILSVTTTTTVNPKSTIINDDESTKKGTDTSASSEAPIINSNSDSDGENTVEDEETDAGKDMADGDKEKSNQKGSEEANEKEKKIQKDAEFNASETTSQNEYRPKRVCTPPAIEQFPRPLMGPYARRHGGLVIHVLVAVFTFIGLAIVCDEYFVSSLDRICEEMQLAPDVAGATFMAAGSSAPELATVVIGVFCAKDDIGVSGVIGSAVFNIMFVISVCALCAGTVSHLNWWPLCRDCFFYAVSILVMLFTIADGYVTWPEALFMLIMYVVYCVALKFNNELERLALRLPLPFKLPTREEQAALVTYRSAKGTASGPGAPAGAGDNQYTQVEGATNETPLQATSGNTDGTYDNAGYNAESASSWNSGPVWDPNQAWSDDQTGGNTWDSSASWNTNAQQAPQQESKPPPTPQQQAQPAPIPQPAMPNYYKAKEYNPETAVDPLVKPTNANQLQLAVWYVVYPIHWSCRHTMPDCRGRWYPITFLVSMLWISFYSYIMVWMITIIGATLSIPDTVMGLTFVAAGVSVPDALSSLAVIKEGYGDMAVSNAVGSNVFDILVCLGLPWFIQTALILPGSHVNVISKGLTYSTLSLLSTVVFLVVATHANGWKLDRKYGVVLMIWYLLFITFASLYELNVFGIIHPPDCVSDY